MVYIMNLISEICYYVTWKEYVFMIFYNEFEFGKNGGVRAFTSARVNLSSILHRKSYLFYFTHPILQNTHISSSIIHYILYK